MKPSCYVAGRDRDHVNRIQEIVEDHGYVISFDWTEGYENTPRTVELAEIELHAARDSDLLVLCWTDNMLGAFMELGAAMAAGRNVVILGAERDSIFWRLDNVTLIETENELAAVLSELHPATA